VAFFEVEAVVSVVVAFAQEAFVAEPAVLEPVFFVAEWLVASEQDFFVVKLEAVGVASEFVAAEAPVVAFEPEYWH
jgi:hypothetical protein